MRITPQEVKRLLTERLFYTMKWRCYLCNREAKLVPVSNYYVCIRCINAITAQAKATSSNFVAFDGRTIAEVQFTRPEGVAPSPVILPRSIVRETVGEESE